MLEILEPQVAEDFPFIEVTEALQYMGPGEKPSHVDTLPLGPDGLSVRLVHNSSMRDIRGILGDGEINIKQGGSVQTFTPLNDRELPIVMVNVTIDERQTSPVLIPGTKRFSQKPLVESQLTISATHLPFGPNEGQVVVEGELAMTVHSAGPSAMLSVHIGANGLVDRYTLSPVDAALHTDLGTMSPSSPANDRWQDSVFKAAGLADGMFLGAGADLSEIARRALVQQTFADRSDRIAPLSSIFKRQGRRNSNTVLSA